nr:hypothetical protein CFP56_77623 [Quercus suber]
MGLLGFEENLVGRTMSQKLSYGSVCGFSRFMDWDCRYKRTPVGREICFRGLEYLAYQKCFKIAETMSTIFKHLPRLFGTVSGIPQSSTSRTTRDTNGFGPQTTDNN